MYINGLVLLDLRRPRRETWWFGRGLFRGWEVESRLKSGGMKTLWKLFGRKKIVKLRMDFSLFACVFSHNGCIKVAIQHVVQSIMMPMMRLAIGLTTMDEVTLREIGQVLFHRLLLNFLV